MTFEELTGLWQYPNVYKSSKRVVIRDSLCRAVSACTSVMHRSGSLGFLLARLLA